MITPSCVTELISWANCHCCEVGELLFGPVQMVTDRRELLEEGAC